MKFYTATNRPKRIPTPAGDAYLEIFQEEIIKDGKKELVCIGKTNIWEKIQEDKEKTEIQNVLQAVAIGDLSVLKKQEPQYIDATTLPKNLMEANNIVLKAKQEFEKMPLEIKEKFDHSAEVYVNTIGTKEWLEKMAPYNDYLTKIKEAGSLKEYNKRVADQAKFENDVAAAKGVKHES